ncbi:MAG: hypothetical protein ACT6TH_15170 [Brevundimonas sp.]|uniref:hypothetical protein n=1 Tax=Brevundimonas sp. TaxID=1871086 RepID=UPI004033B21A
MTPNKNEGLIARFEAKAKTLRDLEMTGFAEDYEEAARDIQDLEAEVGRLRGALQQIAQPPYGLGFNRLRGLARKALASPVDGEGSLRPSASVPAGEGSQGETKHHHGERS